MKVLVPCQKGDALIHSLKPIPPIRSLSSDTRRFIGIISNMATMYSHAVPSPRNQPPLFPLFFLFDDHQQFILVDHDT